MRVTYERYYDLVSSHSSVSESPWRHVHSPDANGSMPALPATARGEAVTLTAAAGIAGVGTVGAALAEGA